MVTTGDASHPASVTPAAQPSANQLSNSSRRSSSIVRTKAAAVAARLRNRRRAAAAAPVAAHPQPQEEIAAGVSSSNDYRMKCDDSINSRSQSGSGSRRMTGDKMGASAGTQTRISRGASGSGAAAWRALRTVALLALLAAGPIALLGRQTGLLEALRGAFGRGQSSSSPSYRLGWGAVGGGGSGGAGAGMMQQQTLAAAAAVAAAPGSAGAAGNSAAAAAAAAAATDASLGGVLMRALHALQPSGSGSPAAAGSYTSSYASGYVGGAGGAVTPAAAARGQLQRTSAADAAANSGFETADEQFPHAGGQQKAGDAVNMIAVVAAGKVSPYQGAPWGEVVRHMSNRLRWSNERFNLEVITEDELKVSSDLI